MKRFLTIALLILAADSLAVGQAAGRSAVQESKAEQELTPQQRLAREEIIEAARAYKAGRFSEAELHSRRALELDPNDRNAPFFIARSIHAQYKQGVDTPENFQIAERAIEAYKRILIKDVNNDESFKAVAFLLGQLNRSDEQIEWITQRAENQTVDPAKRSETYVYLANREWECSFQITERKENQETVERDGIMRLVFKKPKNLNDFDRAKQCALRGMEMVERAIYLSPENGKAWGYKTNLLLELVKLSEMDGIVYDRDEYKRQADEAQKRTIEISERTKASENALESNAPAESVERPPPPPPKP